MAKLTAKERTERLQSFLYDMDFRSNTKANLNEILDNLERLGFDAKWMTRKSDVNNIQIAIVRHLNDIDEDMFESDLKAYHANLARKITKKLFEMAAKQKGLTFEVALNQAA